MNPDEIAATLREIAAELDMAGFTDYAAFLTRLAGMYSRG